MSPFPGAVGRFAGSIDDLRAARAATSLPLLAKGFFSEFAELREVRRAGADAALLLLRESCTVTIAHSRTRDLPEVVRRADIVVAAVGRPNMVTGAWLKPGATVIDVGINRTEAGLVGDVDFASAWEVAGAITPVPGGVGPMTIAMLIRNTFVSAARTEGFSYEKSI